MTDVQFDVLDELYFVQSFMEVSASVDISESELVTVLVGLHDKGWIRVFETPDKELDGKVGIVEHYASYYFLASKQGLLAHNMI